MKRNIAFLFVVFALTACSSQPRVITATPEPTLPETATVAPNNTNPPTNTATITSTSKPTNTPQPTSTPRPTTTRTPTPAPVFLSGTGDSVVDLKNWVGAGLAHITYSGRGNFIVWNYGSNGEKIDLLVNTIGAYDGVVLLDFYDTQTTRFQIESSGAWEITVLPIENVRMVEIPGLVTGRGDDVVMIVGLAAPDLLKMDASLADRNFIVHGHGNGKDLLANEIAPYTGIVIVDQNLPIDRNGVFALLLEVKATGDWTIEVTVR
jgi:hypothetical protein